MCLLNLSRCPYQPRMVDMLKLRARGRPLASHLMRKAQHSITIRMALETEPYCFSRGDEFLRFPTKRENRIFVAVMTTIAVAGQAYMDYRSVELFSSVVRILPLDFRTLSAPQLESVVGLLAMSALTVACNFAMFRCLNLSIGRVAMRLRYQ